MIRPFGTKVAIKVQTPHKYSITRVFALDEGRGEIGNFPKSTAESTIETGSGPLNELKRVGVGVSS